MAVVNTILNLTDRMSQPIIKVTSRTKALEAQTRKVNKTIANMGKNFVGTVDRIVSRTAKVTGVGLFTGLSAGLTEAVGLEGFRAQLETATKDVDKAKNLMKWANNYANITPFETGEVVESTAKLEAMGLSAKKVLPQIADMAGSTNKSIDQATEAIIDAQAGNHLPSMLVIT